ncbi:uncharacterized protein LOC110931839 [Helianthus annuus]|uniref:uncharacterized protein LOC110931839 n=1 Tax=Helianthus annuus TaxID=4232 RepID=UPI000B907B4D|nr:uncharacterized protein LOC110931839 [Helianthus annuus]
MRQRHWLETVKDYDCEIHYHPGKANIVADALSRKEEYSPIRVQSMQLVVTSGLLDRIKEAQTEAVKEENLKKERIVGQLKDLKENRKGLKTRFDRIWVPNTCNVKTLLLDEAHKSRYFFHLGATKMYKDLKQNYWRPGMKRDITNYHSSIGMAPYEMLYGRKCRTLVCWGDVGPRELAHKDIVSITNEKIEVIRAHLKAAQDRQKSYAEKRRTPIEFQVGDMVMLKVSPWKGVIRFRKRGKLSPRFIGPFKIVERVADETAYISYDDIEVDDKLNYVVKPIEILDRKVKSLRHKEINQVKVKWEHRRDQTPLGGPKKR